MSLETQIEELNANIVTLTEAILHMTGNPSADELDDEVEKVAAKKPAAKKPAAKKAAAKKPAAKKGGKLNYDKDIKPRVLMAIEKPEGRKAVVDLLEEFDAASAKEVKPEDYKTFLAGVEEIIDANADDE